MTTNWQDPTGTPPQPPTGGNSYQNKGKRFAIVAILLVVIAGLATTAGLVMVNRGDDASDAPQYVVMDIADTTPVFEPRDAAGADPFNPLENQLVHYRREVEEQIDEQVAIAQANAEPGETVVRPEFDVAALDANVKTGLYGGTAENTCDPERLISFLYSQPDLLAAWAGVQGIPVANVADYIRSLEVRVLAEPVNVLNHGYDSDVGAAYEVDTVLDAGTAVLVDENGDVRTRCYCGNPIKPKPPEHMPPRCLVFGALVYTEPGGSTKREDALRDVLLTGRQTTLGNGANWLEVKWGTADNQVGWTQANNLRTHYCPTPTSDRFCPGPGATKVWHTPDMTTHVGQVTGKVHTHDTTLDIFAPINPVGGIGSEIVVNDFMMIRFTEAAPSVQNSAWVKLSDLNQDSSQCERIRQCVDTDGPVRDRAGGGAIVSPAGVQWVEFTGHFIGDPFVTFAEVRVNDGTGNYGWMSNFYTPLADAECEPPVYDCIELGVLYDSSDMNNLIGQLANVEVTIIGGPENGRVEVQVDAPTGPTGWVGTNVFYDGSGECPPVPGCYDTSGLAWTEFPASGMSILPVGDPTTISLNGAYVEDAGIGYLWINIGGTDYWIFEGDLQSVPEEDCFPDLTADCSAIERPPVDDFLPTLREIETLDLATESRAMTPDDVRLSFINRCCVDALYNSTNVGDPSADPVPRWATVVGSSEVAGVTWFETLGPRFFRQADVVDPALCAPSECPEGTRIPGKAEILDSILGLDRELDLGDGRLLDRGAIGDIGEPRFENLPERPVNNECCVSQLFSGFQVGELPLLSPVFVTIESGPHGAAPAWYKTTDGTWFPETAIVDADQCRPPVECPTNETDPGRPGSRFPGGVDLDTLKPAFTTETSDSLLVADALDRLVGQPSTWCCVEGNVYDGIDGALKGTIDEPTMVMVTGVNEDGSWLRIALAGPPNNGWVMSGQFLPVEDCRPDGGCPEVGAGIGIAVIDRERCCAEILGPNGVVFEYVNLTGDTREGDLGTEYETVDGEWITIIAFVSNDLCRPDGGCPEFSIIDVQEFAAGEIEICCIAVGNGFEAAGLTGNSRFDEDGNLELERNTGEWIPIDDFVGAGRCLPDAECPSVSVISPNDPSVCCVNLGNGEFAQITLTGEQRNGDDGVEYEATNGEWYLFPDDFANTGRCIDDTPPPCNGTVIGSQCCERPNEVFNGQCVPPCPTGQVRNANGVCVTPETPCPAGQVRDAAGSCVTPGCQNSDDDDICDVDDNCDFNTNQDQADADQDGFGDKCDPCTDADGDLFCEIPGDINNDNCWGEWNPEQSDVDGDGVGDPCDNCPNTPNSDQLNTDGLGTGDACEQPDCPREVTGAPGDLDADGICNDEDNCPRTPNSDQRATDDDLFGDACDKCPGIINSTNVDSDGDGWGNDCDICPGPNGPVDASQIPNPDQGFLYDADGDGTNDTCFPPTSSVN